MSIDRLNKESGVEHYMSERGELMAIVIRSWQGRRRYDEGEIIPANNGLKFYTSPQEHLQVGMFCHPEGYLIDAHIHHRTLRPIDSACEVIRILEGVLEVTLIDSFEVKTVILYREDTIVLISGGHAFKVISSVEAFYVKQGPYIDRDSDKTIISEMPIKKD